MPKPQKNHSRPKVQGVLFDLDGTLLDTYKDMSAALNTVLKSYAKPPIRAELVRPYVSKGAMAMICYAFGCEPNSAHAQSLWQAMLAAYADDIAHATCMFDGMETVLHTLESTGLKWGIVTNKPGALTHALLQKMHLAQRCGSVVCGDTLAVKKPDPRPLLHACKELQLNPNHALYVGDDRRDIEAGTRAGMTTLAAAYGYQLPDDSPYDWGADAVITQPIDLQQWLN